MPCRKLPEAMRRPTTRWARADGGNDFRGASVSGVDQPRASGHKRLPGKVRERRRRSKLEPGVLSRIPRIQKSFPIAQHDDFNMSSITGPEKTDPKAGQRELRM